MYKKGDEFPTIMCLESSKKFPKEDPMIGLFISMPSVSSIFEGNVNISATKVIFNYEKDWNKDALNEEIFSNLCDNEDANKQDFINLLNKIDKYGLLSYQNIDDDKEKS